MWTGSQVLVTRATDHSVLDEWSEDGPFWIFWFLSSHSTGSLVGGCPTSAVVRELTNFRNAPLFITRVPNSLGSSFRHNFHFCPSCKCRALVPNFARLARQNCACAVDARLLRMCGRRDSNDWTAVVTTMNILIFSYFQIRFSDERGETTMRFKDGEIPTDDENSWLIFFLWKMWERCSDEKEIHQTLCALPNSYRVNWKLQCMWETWWDEKEI